MAADAGRLRPRAGGETRWKDQGQARQRCVDTGLTPIGARIARLHVCPSTDSYKKCAIAKPEVPQFHCLCGDTDRMEILIIRDAVTRHELNDMAKQQFGDMVKAVVDVEQGIMAIGGELHSDEEAVLLDQGSVQQHLWGINLYPERLASEWIEFDSMINVRPSGGNRSRYVESAETRDIVTTIVNRLVTG